MDDDTFIQRMQQRIEESAGAAVNLDLNHKHNDKVDVPFTNEPRIAINAHAPEPASLARTFTQYTTPSTQQGRKAHHKESTRFLRRN